VVGEVEDAVNGAGDGCPDYVHTTGEGSSAEVADVGADVGLETGFDVHGEGFKSPARCGLGDVLGAAKEFEEKGFWLRGSYVENVRKFGHVGGANPGCFLPKKPMANEGHVGGVALRIAEGAGVAGHWIADYGLQITDCGLGVRDFDGKVFPYQ
jgi:hypothetical protein